MPVTSHQVGGLIGGQQAMFGNFHSYAQQISPYGQQGPVGYSNPMAGMGEMMQPPPAPNMENERIFENLGTRAVGMTGHLPGAIGAVSLAGSIGGMMGSRAMGAVGNVAGAFDPFSAGLSGFARGIGWQSGAGIGANLGRLGSMGIGGIARAGMAGLGTAAIAALPAMALTETMRYATGQMVQGAQYQNQVGSVLQNQFRFLNPQGGTGFATGERQGIASMLREMGHKEMMSSPEEMLRILQQGAGMGMFKAVQDARQFRTKFQEMVGTLKEVAKTMNTTLEGAMPFLGQARQMGFWTPQDIMRNVTQTRTISAATGMSGAQVQNMMMQGAQMSRSIGGEGFRGARGMARSLEWAGAAVGGPGRKGIWSEEEISEMTGGLQGAEATQAMAGMMQTAATNFARGGHARWTLAALGGKNYQHLDPAKLRELAAGRMGIGAIGGGARGNIARQGAANFVMNEERLRGELLEQGPEAQLGFIRSIIGDRLHSEEPMQQYITRRMMKRYFGVDSRMADALAKAAREMPSKMREQRAAAERFLDKQERDNEEQFNRSWDGVKRQIGKWWQKTVDEPLQSIGATTAAEVQHTLERFSDRVFGRVAERHRMRGVRGGAAMAFEKGLWGDQRSIERTFGTVEQMQEITGGGRAGFFGDVGGAQGIGAMFAGQDVGRGKMGWAKNLMLGDPLSGGMGSLSNARIEQFRRMGVGERYFGSEEERRAFLASGKGAGYGASSIQGGAGGLPTGLGGAFAGAGLLRTLTGQGGARFGVMDVEEATRQAQGLGAAVTGRLTEEGRKGLGFSSLEEGNKLVESARGEMEKDTDYQRRAALHRARNVTKTDREHGMDLVRAVEAGQIGGPALRKLLQGAKTDTEKVHRLAAAQSEDMRKQRGAIKLEGEIESLGGSTPEILARGGERKIAEHLEKAEAQLGELTTQTEQGRLGKAAGAWYDVVSNLWGPAKLITDPWADKLFHRTTPATIDSMMRKGGEEVRQAIKDLHATDANGKPDEKRRKDALGKLQGFVARGDLTDDERKAADTLVRGGDPGNKEAFELTRSMAVGLSAQDLNEFGETVGRRMDRMRTQLGANRAVMTELTGKTESGSAQRRLGKALDELISGSVRTPGAMKKKLEEISALTSEAGKTKEGRAYVEQIQGLVSQAQGGEMVSGLLSESLTAKGRAELITGGGRGAAGETIDAMVSLTGQKITSKQVDALRKGDAKTREALLAGLEGSQREKAERFISALGKGKGGAGDVEDILKTIGVVRAGQQLTGVAKVEERVKKAEAGTMFGRLGSADGMHQTAMQTNLLLERIAKAVETMPKTGNPKEEPKTGKTEGK